MAEAGLVKGDKRLELFRQIQENRTLVTFRLPGKDYERLTIISAIKKKNHYFCIDPLKGFIEKLAETDSWKIQFRFTGADKINYAFETSEGEIIEDEVWIRFPGFIERMQRRRHFRVEAPLGTKLFCLIKEVKRELDIINLSLRGALVVPVRLKKEHPTSQIIQEGETLTAVELLYSSENKDTKILVDLIAVRRVEQLPETGIFRYALEIMKIDKKEDETLTELIYLFQRYYLRNR